MPADALFEIGSITKQFTAAALLKLRDEGKLSLDDDITRWLPDFDTRGNRVTLRRLLGLGTARGLQGLPEAALRALAERLVALWRTLRRTWPVIWRWGPTPTLTAGVRRGHLQAAA